MDSFEQEQLISNFEHPDINILLSYVVPISSSVDTVKSLFCALACQYSLQCSSPSPYRMEAECTFPFSAKIKLKIQQYENKGYVVSLRYKKTHFPFLAFSSLLTNPMSFSCPSETVAQCSQWYECSVHGEGGLVVFYQNFFEEFKFAVIRAQISIAPIEQEINVQGTSFVVNGEHKGSLSFQERFNLFSDIPVSAVEAERQWVIEVESDKKISLSLRKNEAPNFFFSDWSQPANKNGDIFTIKMILDDITYPKLSAGRWFLSLRGGAVFGKSNFSISCALRSKPEVHSVIEDDDEWIMIADDSSAAGRKGKAELITGFPAQPKMVKKNRPLYTSSSEGEFALAGQFSDLNLHSPVHSVSTDSGSDSRNSMDIPSHFLCPISRQLMRKPVIAADGHTYELNFIERWLEDHIRSPMTGQEMPHKMLIANFNLKSQIDEWKSSPLPFEDDPFSF